LNVTKGRKSCLHSYSPVYLELLPFFAWQ
jgi:hypothetical protein